MFFVPLWITFDATSFPSSQTGGFSSFHPQSRLSLVGVNQNYFSWSASTVPTPSSVYSSAGIELTASCFSGGIELYHSSHSRVSSDKSDLLNNCPSNSTVSFSAYLRCFCRIKCLFPRCRRFHIIAFLLAVH